jgi:hypothetical protein
MSDSDWLYRLLGISAKAHQINYNSIRSERNQMMKKSPQSTQICQIYQLLYCPTGISSLRMLEIRNKGTVEERKSKTNPDFGGYHPNTSRDKENYSHKGYNLDSVDKTDDR